MFMSYMPGSFACLAGRPEKRQISREFGSDLGNPGQEASMTIPTRRKGSTRNSSIRSSSRKKEFADLVKADAVKWELIMRESGLKVE